MKNYKKRFLALIIFLIISLIVVLIFYLIKSKPKFYMVHLNDVGNKDIESFVGGGIIVDSNYKDSFSFTVKSLIPRGDESITCPIDYYNKFRVYIGNDEGKSIILDTNRINVDTVYIDDNNYNNFVNILLRNKDNIYFCFVPEYESTVSDETCLKAYIIESD